MTMEDNSFNIFFKKGSSTRSFTFHFSFSFFHYLTGVFFNVFAERGGVKVIMDAMERNIAHPGVCKWGCHALWDIQQGNSKRHPSTSLVSRFRSIIMNNE